MISIFNKLNSTLLFSLFFLFGLLSALFYTGANVWLFTCSFIFIVLNIAIVLQQRFFQPINISLNGIFISVILLFIWFAISIFPSQIKYLSLYNFFWLGSLLLVFILFSFIKNQDNIWRIVWPGILFFITLWAIYGLVQYYYLRVPSNATFLNRNSLAALISLALIPASGYFLLKENQRPWKILNNKVLSTILILLFLAIFIIASRGASLCLFLGFSTLFVLLRKQLDKTQLYSFITIIFIAFLTMTLSRYLMTELPQGFTDRLASVYEVSKAGNSRIIIWKSLIPLLNEMPWYGLGLGSLWIFWPPFRSTNDTSAGFFAHNDYLQITLEAGYPGILLLFSLCIFTLIHFIRILKNNNLSLIQRVEIVSLFATFITFSSHSLLTYNFYILPLLIIVGFYLGRFNQLITLNSTSNKTVPALKLYFKPIMFIFSLGGLILILMSYFISVSLSSYYNDKAKKLMVKNRYQESNTLFLKAQTLAPLMDNSFFSHADLLRRGANKLISINNMKQANSLLKLAHLNLDKAETLNPLRPQTHHLRGLIYERKQPEKAIVQFNQALKLDPYFLYSRIRLATLYNQQKQLKKAIDILYKGVNYKYPVNKVMFEYMTLFARLSREAGIDSFALDLEENMKKLMTKSRLMP